jgi:methyl-accepting chemotaxis protein
MGLSLGQALIIVTQVIGIVWIAAGIKSDVRDNSTRITQHDREIDDLKKDQARDREESSKILRELNTKASDLNASVQILLDRTAPKHP